MGEFLRIEGLKKRFGGRDVLRGLDLALDEGRVYGLLGRNGEGKTTLARILMGIIPPDAGTLLVGETPRPFGSPDCRREFGYVPEDPFFYGGMTVWGFLDLNAGFYRGWDRKRAAAAVERFGLERGSRIRTLSRGMKLKLGLAAALAACPRLLVLDDPTSGLDVPTRRDFLGEVVRELADAGTTILFATHLVHELERIVERLGILHGGRLVVEEDFEKLRGTVRRVELTFADAPPRDLGFDGVLSEKRNGRHVQAVVHPWTAEAEARASGLRAVQCDVLPMSLEDIFVSFVAEP